MFMGVSNSMSTLSAVVKNYGNVLYNNQPIVNFSCMSVVSRFQSSESMAVISELVAWNGKYPDN